MTLRLLYFDFPFWRAEVSRIALYLGDVPFEDVRVSREAFREMKASGELPYGQLPVLDVDGVRLAQSVAIARYCGALAGLYPSDDALAAARVDEILETANQITYAVSPSVRESDPERKAAMRAELGATILPGWLALLERRLADNDSADVFVGDEVSVADLAIWRLLGWLTGGILDGIPTDLLAPHQRLQAHLAHIDAHPGVQAWVNGDR